METIVPLISSDTAGPLGVKHLPRLWIKALLSATGKLPEGYKDIRPGFDYIVLEGLGLEPDSAREYIFRQRPTYLAFENWIREQPNADLSEGNIAKINHAIESMNKSPDTRAKLLEENGLPKDTPIENAVMLNNLDDWRAIHEQLAD